MSVEIHALVGPYALDALDDVERAAFERHLRECEPCRLEADDLRETAARLADGAWSVPPPGLRDNVLAAIGNTRQVSAPATRSARPVRRMWVAAAAAVVVAAGAAGAGAWTIQDQRVRTAQATAAQEARVRTILTAPDVVLREETLDSGGRVTVASSRLQDAGVIMLSADGAPAAGRVYQTWTIRAGTPSSAGALGEGQSAAVQVIDGLPEANQVGVTVEAAPGATTPSAPLDALVELT
ncbi:anti-sigma factor RsiW [Actinoplanes lutulentus]|uniref:Regulator of SigK n=1 Tax=Actinoplanes lutulentus TaxID=1287878 RepID=A0A327Z0F5_9ACTN|nr:anti-sigma factor [Actinoplanes lutulentus]MBB2943507.1 anti-sigma factor RsiW [Actinoplanes lutulentus]RAK25974.1 putative zinc finger protein [Actinoplanes lutulentus]